MCIIFSIANGNPQPGGYKLIVASNRDEFYSRPASPAKEWSDYPFVYGGSFMSEYLVLSFLSFCILYHTYIYVPLYIYALQNILLVKYLHGEKISIEVIDKNKTINRPNKFHCAYNIK